MKALVVWLVALLLRPSPLARSARIGPDSGRRLPGGDIKAFNVQAHNREEQQQQAGTTVFAPTAKETWHKNPRNLPSPLNQAASQLLANGPEGLDDTATVFTQEAVQAYLPQLSEPADSEAPPLDLNHAKLMARLTSAAYCSDKAVISAWTCTRCKRVPNFKPYQVIFDEQWDLMSYIGYLQELDAIVVVFRGTDSGNWGNWLNDLKSWRQDKQYPLPEAPHAFVHAGFLSLWTDSSLRSNITAAAEALRKQHNTPRLFVTGHSMGAAMSSLCALDLKFKLGFSDVRSWTFGSPRVGNLAWQQTFNSIVQESWRFTHNRDIVPSLPPELMGFRHLAREAWIVDVETPFGAIDSKILVCDGSGEDPSCHNSACFLGWCSSVTDHLMYLGIEMYKSPMEC